MYGFEDIVFTKVLPNFCTKCLLLLLIAMHSIHASVKPCPEKEIALPLL